METKPYKIICGSSKDINNFEERVSSAIELGYDLSDDLITQPITHPSGEVEILFYQPVIFNPDDDEFEIDDEESFEEKEDYVLS